MTDMFCTFTTLIFLTKPSSRPKPSLPHVATGSIKHNLVRFNRIELKTRFQLLTLTYILASLSHHRISHLNTIKRPSSDPP